jgi:GT2 family glycosyltransferase
MIHVLQPYSLEKKLGHAYNESMSYVPNGQWAILMDHDAMFLTPDAIRHIHEYTQLFPSTGIFTCYTNRLHPMSKGQLWKDVCSEDSDIRTHIRIAEEVKRDLYKATELRTVIGGFCMVIKKETWIETKFTENLFCLGVDNDFSRRVMATGKKVLRMDGIYMFHTYRLMNGFMDKKHLI